jgi:hypothetical protein
MMLPSALTFSNKLCLHFSSPMCDTPCDNRVLKHSKKKQVIQLNTEHISEFCVLHFFIPYNYALLLGSPLYTDFF